MKTRRELKFQEEEYAQALSTLVDMVPEEACRAGDALFYETTEGRWDPTSLYSARRLSLPSHMKRLWVTTLVVAVFAILATLSHYMLHPQINFAAMAAVFVGASWLVHASAARKREIARIKTDRGYLYDKAVGLARMMQLPHVSDLSYDLLKQLSMRTQKLARWLPEAEIELRRARKEYHSLVDIHNEYHQRRAEHAELEKERDAFEQANPVLGKAAALYRDGERTSFVFQTLTEYRKTIPRYKDVDYAMRSHEDFFKEKGVALQHLELTGALLAVKASNTSNDFMLSGAHYVYKFGSAEQWAQADLRHPEAMGEQDARWYRGLALTIVPAFAALIVDAVYIGTYIVAVLVALIVTPIHLFLMKKTREAQSCYNPDYQRASKIRERLQLFSLSDVTFPLIRQLGVRYEWLEQKRKEEEERQAAARRERRRRAEKYQAFTEALEDGTATAEDRAYWDSNPVQPAEVRYVEEYLQPDPEPWSPSFNVAGTTMIEGTCVDVNGNMYGYDPGPAGSYDPFENT